MGSNNTLRNKIDELDSVQLISGIDKEKLWDSVSRESKTPSIYWRYWVAASVILVASIAYLYAPLESGKEKSIIEHSELTDLQVEAEQFIAAVCQSQSAICKSDEFVRLHEQLLMMNNELNEIQIMIDQYGDDDLLIENQIRLNIDKSKVTQELVNMIVS